MQFAPNLPHTGQIQNRRGNMPLMVNGFNWGNGSIATVGAAGAGPAMVQQSTVGGSLLVDHRKM